jgi:hypothetical protein
MNQISRSILAALEIDADTPHFSFGVDSTPTFSNFSATQSSRWMDSLDGLSSHDFSKEDSKKVRLDSKVRLVIPCDLSVVVHQLMSVANYCPGVQIFDGRIGSVLLRIADREIRISNPENSPSERMLMLETASGYLKYQECETKFFDKLFAKKFKSDYSAFRNLRFPRVASYWRIRPAIQVEKLRKR